VLLLLLTLEEITGVPSDAYALKIDLARRRDGLGPLAVGPMQ
jgi:hypothetical protein